MTFVDFRVILIISKFIDMEAAMTPRDQAGDVVREEVRGHYAEAARSEERAVHAAAPDQIASNSTWSNGIRRQPAIRPLSTA